MMMRKLLALLIFATSVANAQYTIKGTMTPPEKSDFVMLHKLEGVKPKFIGHTTIKYDTVKVGGEQQALGRFTIQLPANAKPGAYRATYRNQGSGFIDFLYNKENIEFIFNPKFPDQSVVFTSSRENKLYNDYLQAYAKTQNKLDSYLLNYIKTPSKEIKKSYKKTLKELKELQEIYETKSEGMLTHHFIKASQRYNPSSLFESVDEFSNFTIENFFKYVDFSSPQLYNSSFIIDKVNDYIFYLNTSEDPEAQKDIYKESINTVLSKVSKGKLRKDLVQFLITSFTDKRDGEMVDWLFAEHYNDLPSEDQDEEFKSEKLQILNATVGRTAPDFSWKKGETEHKLSSLNDGDKYLLVFWSTSCPHCVKDVPELHNFMQSHKNVSVISFGIENESDKDAWVSFTTNKLPNWHNAIGTHPEHKWSNETVQKYNLLGTPSYFVLDQNKKIIAMPDQFEDVKKYFESH
ncbi:TlpA disulfide reductase family protein [uncultured Tenacibaculum sp.]|uniref:TlpA family protein disulfide reductase n=1 Tax=uncultured Tenacibaculum sp. TaxID=174713 RepID=UPI0026361D48|nr:TlpA disulfide reductase family protein [uncultured Tenacibaculum sp.]